MAYIVPYALTNLNPETLILFRIATNNPKCLVAAKHFKNVVKVAERFVETMVSNDATKQAHECEHEHVSKNKYFWNSLMMCTKYFKNIPMPHRNDVENIFPYVHG